MPYSHPAFDQEIEKFIKKNKFIHFLDIGSGAGKYGRIIKRVLPEAEIYGIESEKSYIKDFKLNEIYTQVYNDRVENFFDNRPNFTTDVAIIGDCIEHLKKSVGIDLINYLIYRCHFLILVFPTKLIQYAWQGHAQEAHISVWSEHDFKQFDHKYYKKKFMNLVIIKGYLADSQAFYVGE